MRAITPFIIIIIINEFHRDASLKQNFRAAKGHLVTNRGIPMERLYATSY